MELCFHLFPVQVADVELLCRISSLLRSELQFELAVDKSVISTTLRTGHHSHENIFQVPLAHKHIVKKMKMLRLRMHPSCFQTIFLLEIVLLIGSWYSLQNSSRRRQLQLLLPMLGLPWTPFQATESLPTLALKSPRIRTLSFAGVLLKCLCISE